RCYVSLFLSSFALPRSPLFPYTTLFRSPGITVNSNFWAAPKYADITSYNRTKQPFTQLQITDKGLAELARYVEFIRSVTGNEIRSEEHTSELQSRENLVCRLLLEKKNYI